MTRIAFATDGVFPAAMGGMARHSAFLVRHLARRDVSVDVFHPGPDLCFDDPHVREFIVPWPRYRFKGHYLAESRTFARRVAAGIDVEGPYDVAYGQGLSLWGRVRKVGCPCLVNPHGLEFLQVGGPTQRVASLPMRMAFRSTLGGAARVVSLGGALTGLLIRRLGVSRSTIAIIPNGVDIDYVDAHTGAPEASADGKRFLFVGRLAFNKGLPELISAFQALAGTGPELVIAGEGEMRSTVERMITTPSVRVVGAVGDDELFELLRSATCFVLPTRGEGMPTAILEAMACGLPVIATDVGAVSELVDERNGLLIEPGDAVAIRAAVEKIAGMDAGSLEAMGRASRRRVEERFTWERVADRTLEVLEEMVREPVGG